ncbi:PTPLA-domain-containing protein [Aspergillus eucalypticola CBS 122712]|uniref:Very-long-chain (3R)-3-hydroxyacyl-CoA dehydratase n=1 Tax=Aspergillus eucalypticola (strain CBS 122712 / IBT 29274) TaxID=1448314 RepID=A0A317VET1_ASPEC|nr:PTPLA-domain-containing protein [Aspergillus eucalypticola CBS 122712]PWY72866.1 PTPLA-domain-containing protein [Aspergillus eucalypticola CBS 122712]
MPSLRTTYLATYNTINALLWLYIFSSIILSPFQSPQTIYVTLEPWTRWTQTIAILEILHAALGLTRSPIFTTFTQIFARSVQVWAINYAYPETTSSSLAYKYMLPAWSFADAIRYSYFAVLSAGAPVPGLLRWLRYSLFLILYPIGIGSEWWLMFRALRVTNSIPVQALYVFFLFLYGPGSPMMYSYMVKQRRKTLAGGKEWKEKK